MDKYNLFGGTFMVTILSIVLRKVSKYVVTNYGKKKSRDLCGGSPLEGKCLSKPITMEIFVNNM